MVEGVERRRLVENIRQTMTAGATLIRSCEVLGLNIRTYQRWLDNGEIKCDARPKALRPTPKNKLTETERQAILDCCNRHEFSRLPPSQIIPKLADEGRYIASESTFYRVLKSEGQLNHRGHSKSRKPHKKPTSFTATGPNQVWSWDISYLPTGVIGKHYYLYMIMDIYSRKIVGTEVYESENGEDAADLLQRSIWAEKSVSKGVVLHSDNGAPMKSFTLREKMYDLGVVTSRSRPRVSNDNPYSEALFKTVKYCPQWPKEGFSELSIARQWVDKFKHWYNNDHQHSGIKFVTPSERHSGKDRAILKKRTQVYECAQQTNPTRWSRSIRNWGMIEEVELNPEIKKTGT